MSHTPPTGPAGPSGPEIGPTGLPTDALSGPAPVEYELTESDLAGLQSAFDTLGEETVRLGEKQEALGLVDHTGPLSRLDQLNAQGLHDEWVGVAFRYAQLGKPYNEEWTPDQPPEAMYREPEAGTEEEGRYNAVQDLIKDAMTREMEGNAWAFGAVRDAQRRDVALDQARQAGRMTHSGRRIRRPFGKHRGAPTIGQAEAQRALWGEAAKAQGHTLRGTAANRALNRVFRQREENGTLKREDHIRSLAARRQGLGMVQGLLGNPDRLAAAVAGIEAHKAEQEAILRDKAIGDAALRTIISRQQAAEVEARIRALTGEPEVDDSST